MPARASKRGVPVRSNAGARMPPSTACVRSPGAALAMLRMTVPVESRMSSVATPSGARAIQ